MPDFPQGPQEFAPNLTHIFQPVKGVLVQTSQLWDTNSIIISSLPESAAVSDNNPEKEDSPGMTSFFSSHPPVTLVVDPGWFPDEIAHLQSECEKTPARRATHILFTHGDYDHVVGWEDFPGAQIIAHPEAALRDPALTEKRVADLDRENNTVRPNQYRYPSKSLFTFRESLNLGGDTLLFFPAPGHQRDALFAVLPERHLLVAGDYLSDREFPFIYYSLTEYKNTLQLAKYLCEKYDVHIEIPGHGRVATSREEIMYRVETDMDYLERLEEAVSRAKDRGMDVAQAAESLSDFTFRGKPIRKLLREHINNVRFLYGEPVQE